MSSFLDRFFGRSAGASTPAADTSANKPAVTAGAARAVHPPHDKAEALDHLREYFGASGNPVVSELAGVVHPDHGPCLLLLVEQRLTLASVEFKMFRRYLAQAHSRGVENLESLRMDGPYGTDFAVFQWSGAPWVEAVLHRTSPAGRAESLAAADADERLLSEQLRHARSPTRSTANYELTSAAGALECFEGLLESAGILPQERHETDEGETSVTISAALRLTVADLLPFQLFIVSYRFAECDALTTLWHEAPKESSLTVLSLTIAWTTYAVESPDA